MTRQLILGLLLALVATSVVLPAGAQGYSPPNSVPWPLLRQATNVPREALGSAFGEYQDNSAGTYLHTGIDIRGAEGDQVIAVADGDIWVAYSFADDFCDHASFCRLYITDANNDYIYYYAHLRLNGGITSDVREAIIASTMGEPETAIEQGDILSSIGPFYNSWPHLHFGIVDGGDNYDAINPLTALDRTHATVDLFDDEPPVISELELFADGTTTDVTPNDECNPLSGAVDIAATMSDSFYTTNPAPAPFTGGVFSSFGVYKASWKIRNVDTGVGDGDIWYELDRAPLACAGPDRGDSCPTAAGTIDADEFPLFSFDYDDGMLIMGEPYTPFLFAEALSDSTYTPENQEHYVHILTNTWGEDGNWDTASVPDGWYQVTAIAEDADGNQDSETRFVAIENDGNYSNVGDAYVRDNEDETGEIPSTLGGRPFWTSPDIFIVPEGEVPGINDTPSNTLLIADTDYDVYLRVHNDSCAAVNNISTQIYSANPAMFQNESDWSFVTDEGEWEGSLDLDPGETAFLGPYSWTPTAAEAGTNAGHRCMLAKIDSASDPADNVGVPDDNNYAQRNIQFGVSSFWFNNPGLTSASVGTELRCNGFPFKNPNALMELRVAYNTLVHPVWVGTPGTVVTQSGGNTVVRFTRCNVKLPAVQLPGNTKLAASFKTVLPGNITGSWLLDLKGSLNGVLRGGMSFLAKSP